MTSFQITITPKARAAARFVSNVRRAIQKALAEEHKKSGVTQSDIARAISVNRSVISREIRGHKDLTLSRVAEIAHALGRKPVFELIEPSFEGNHARQPPETGTDGSRLSPSNNEPQISGNRGINERDFGAAA